MLTKLRAGRTRNLCSIRGKCRSCYCFRSFKPDLWSTHSPLQYETWDFTLRVKRPGRDAYHSPRCSAEVQNEWSCTAK